MKKLKIRIHSDLHLEFFGDQKFYLAESDDEKNTILILAGDIILAEKFKKFRYFFEDVYKRFKKIIYINGNHEFYKSTILTTPKRISDGLKGLKRKIYYLENKTKVIENINFICATLWTDFDNYDYLCMYQSKVGMNDFRIIRNGPETEPWLRKFSPEDAYLLHTKSKDFIFNSIKKNMKNVVVTHHGPSTLSIPDEFKGNRLNGAYISNLSEEILFYKPDIWIHGHIHNSFDYMIGNTRVICNPSGYYPNGLNPNYDQKLIIEL